MPSRTKPTAQARQLADALAGAQAVMRDDFASGLWSLSPIRELIRRWFGHQLALALVIHVVQLTDTGAQKVSYQGSKQEIKKLNQWQGEEFLDINLEARHIRATVYLTDYLNSMPPSTT